MKATPAKGSLDLAPDEIGQSTPSPLDSADAVEPLRVLIVDDEPTIRHVIGQVLRLDGHESTEASSGEQALQLFQNQPYPLVITDVIMGAMSGLDLLREIRRLNPDALVVIMTSHASLEVATIALREGAYDFLIKPFEDVFMISALVERASERLALLKRNQLLMEQLELYARELERLNRSLKDMANRDQLTGLFNRRYLLTSLDSEIARAGRDGHPLSLIILDVDHFKHYNDTNGHISGDEVLSAVGQLLMESAGTEAHCARYGGEEFVVWLPETGCARALDTAETIRQRVAGHAFKGRETQPGGAVTVSLGVAELIKNDTDGSALIRRADEALYRAKEKGRNQVQT